MIVPDIRFLWSTQIPVRFFTLRNFLLWRVFTLQQSKYLIDFASRCFLSGVFPKPNLFAILASFLVINVCVIRVGSFKAIYLVVFCNGISTIGFILIAIGHTTTIRSVVEKTWSKIRWLEESSCLRKPTTVTWRLQQWLRCYVRSRDTCFYLLLMCSYELFMELLSVNYCQRSTFSQSRVAGSNPAWVWTILSGRNPSPTSNWDLLFGPFRGVGPR